jgi:hypothetical protein
MTPTVRFSTNNERQISDPRDVIDFFSKSRKLFFQNRVLPSETVVLSSSHKKTVVNVRESIATIRGSIATVRGSVATVEGPKGVTVDSVLSIPSKPSPTKDLYDWYLNFRPIEYRTIEVMAEYRSFCRFGANLPFSIFLCIPYTFLFCTQANGYWFSKNEVSIYIINRAFWCILCIVSQTYNPHPNPNPDTNPDTNLNPNQNQAFFLASFIFACCATVLGVVQTFDRLSLKSHDLNIKWLQRLETVNPNPTSYSNPNKSDM